MTEQPWWASSDSDDAPSLLDEVFNGAGAPSSQIWFSEAEPELVTPVRARPAVQLGAGILMGTAALVAVLATWSATSGHEPDGVVTPSAVAQAMRMATPTSSPALVSVPTTGPVQPEGDVELATSSAAATALTAEGTTPAPSRGPSGPALAAPVTQTNTAHGGQASRPATSGVTRQVAAPAPVNRSASTVVVRAGGTTTTGNAGQTIVLPGPGSTQVRTPGTSVVVGPGGIQVQTGNTVVARPGNGGAGTRLRGSSPRVPMGRVVVEGSHPHPHS